jgi:hypothetical protein
MKNGKRDYKKEYAAYQGKPEQIQNRSERNSARRTAENSGMNVKGKDVDHKKPLSKGGTSSLTNLRAVSKTSNRSFSRNADSSVKSQRSKKGK